MAQERITALDVGLLGGPTSTSKHHRLPARGTKDLPRFVGCSLIAL